MSKFTEEKLVGKTFGKLTVLRKTKIRPAGRKRQAFLWEVKCGCGKRKLTSIYPVVRGATKTCNCGKKEHSKTHGMSSSKLYEKWGDMHQRCHPNYRKSHLYYKKGITVCKKWSSFEGFREEMEKGFQDGLSLDRIDGNKGYFKTNCRWVDQYTQNTNRHNVYLVGKEKVPLKRFCRERDLPYRKLLSEVKEKPEHLQSVLENYLHSKGVRYENGVLYL